MNLTTVCRHSAIAAGIAAIACFSGCHFNYTIVDGYFFSFQGETAEFVDERTIDSGVTRVVVSNRFGNVKISNATDQPGWKWESKVWAETQEQADQFIGEFVMDVQTEGTTQTWTVLLPDQSSDLNGVQSNLTFAVPSNIEVQIENSHGDVELNELSGPLDVENSHGNLSAHQIAEGTLTVSHGDTLVQSASGNVTIDSSHGNVDASGIEGQLTIDGRHTEIKVSGVGGNANIKTTHDNIIVSELVGEVILKNSHGSITATDLQGNVSAKNSHGTTTIATSGDSVSVEGSHGNVIVTVTNESFTLLDLETSHGSIELELPASVNPSITMDTTYGDTDSDFESNDGSPQTVKLKTRHGDVKVRQLK